MELKSLRKYLEHGKIKEIAEKNGVDPNRAWKLIGEFIKPKSKDETFINDCIEAATARKQMEDQYSKRLEAFS